MAGARRGAIVQRRDRHEVGAHAGMRRRDQELAFEHEPAAVRRHADPVGSQNDPHIREGVRRAARVVVAWGAIVSLAGGCN